jgi:hypothetical protein
VVSSALIAESVRRRVAAEPVKMAAKSESRPGQPYAVWATRWSGSGRSRSVLLSPMYGKDRVEQPSTSRAAAFFFRLRAAKLAAYAGGNGQDDAVSSLKVSHMNNE